MKVLSFGFTEDRKSWEYNDHVYSLPKSNADQMIRYTKQDATAYTMPFTDAHARRINYDFL